MKKRQKESMLEHHRHRRRDHIMIYILLFIILILLVILFFRNSSVNYRSLREHQGYFQNNTSPKIEAWMAPHTILRHFNITESRLFQELNVTESYSTLRTPIQDLCQRAKTDCSLIINR